MKREAHAEMKEGWIGNQSIPTSMLGLFRQGRPNYADIEAFCANQGTRGRISRVRGQTNG